MNIKNLTARQGPLYTVHLTGYSGKGRNWWHSTRLCFPALNKSDARRAAIAQVRRGRWPLYHIRVLSVKRQANMIHQLYQPPDPDL